VENGIVTFEVTLENPSHPGLRHNLRTDVYVITQRRSEALRLRRGPYLRPDGRHAVFVIRGDVAVRTPVELGLASFDYYEI
jgi:HlyD family secretion protein